MKASQEVNMFDRAGEVVSVVLGALALAYLIYEIDKRKRKLSGLSTCSAETMRSCRQS